MNRLAQRAETAAPAPTAPESPERASWRETRRRLEARRVASTPVGDRWHLGGAVIEAGIHLAHGLLRLSGLHRPCARRTARVTLVEHALPFRDLPPDLHGYRIAHVTDPHFDGLPELSERVAGLLEGQGIDLLAFTGDYRFRSRGRFVEHGVIDDLERIARAADPRDGCLAVLGNHDTSDMVEAIESRGIRVLVNESVSIRRAGSRLHVTGTDDVHRHYTPAARRALAVPPERDRHFGLALIHSPELADAAAEAGYRLYLSGHTHGGQITGPSGRPLARHLHVHRDLAAGAWRIGGMVGYTSRGAGASGLPIRLNCPGEVTIFTLIRDPIWPA